jgi:hypothetical protein
MSTPVKNLVTTLDGLILFASKVKALKHNILMAEAEFLEDILDSVQPFVPLASPDLWK